MDNSTGIAVSISKNRISTPENTVTTARPGFKSLVFGLSLGVSVLGIAEEAPDTAAGEADYLNYCASCHGVTGEGNGPVAGSLKNRPPDLTFLHQQETDGAFPYRKVLNIIQGNPDYDKNFRSHGPADMPVWGKIIYEDSNERTGITTARLKNLVAYIKSLQK